MSSLGTRVMRLAYAGEKPGTETCSPGYKLYTETYARENPYIGTYCCVMLLKSLHWVYLLMLVKNLTLKLTHGGK